MVKFKNFSLFILRFEKKVVISYQENKIITQNKLEIMKSITEIKAMAKSAMNQVLDFTSVVILKWFGFMNGNFGRYGKLKKQYRGKWQVATWAVFSVLFFMYVMCPLFEWWDGVVRCINYVRWGC